MIFMIENKVYVKRMEAELDLILENCENYLFESSSEQKKKQRRFNPKN